MLVIWLLKNRTIKKPSHSQVWIVNNRRIRKKRRWCHKIAAQENWGNLDAIWWPLHVWMLGILNKMRKEGVCLPQGKKNSKFSIKCLKWPILTEMTAKYRIYFHFLYQQEGDIPPPLWFRVGSDPPRPPPPRLKPCRLIFYSLKKLEKKLKILKKIINVRVNHKYMYQPNKYFIVTL